MSRWKLKKLNPNDINLFQWVKSLSLIALAKDISQKQKNGVFLGFPQVSLSFPDKITTKGSYLPTTSSTGTPA